MFYFAGFKSSPGAHSSFKILRWSKLQQLGVTSYPWGDWDRCRTGLGLLENRQWDVELHQLYEDTRTKSWSVRTAPSLLTLSVTITTACHNVVPVLHWVQLLEIYAIMFLASFPSVFHLSYPRQDSSPPCSACSSAQHSRVPTAWDMQMLPQPLKRRNNDRKQSRENPGAPAGKYHLKALERRESDLQTAWFEASKQKAHKLIYHWKEEQ